MAGKGDVLRPRAVSDKQVEDNWARTFGSPRPRRMHGKHLIVVDEIGAMSEEMYDQLTRPKPPEPKDDTDAKPTLSVDRPGDPEPR